MSPISSEAQNFPRMERLLVSIEDDVDDIEDGTCLKRRLAGEAVRD